MVRKEKRVKKDLVKEMTLELKSSKMSEAI
jgi:hypothetical protein